MEEFTDKIKTAWKNYNIPALIIIVTLEIFKALAFIGHIIFTGLVGEGSNLLPENLKGVTTALNSVSDLMVDATAHMHIEDDCGHSHAHDEHSHEHFDIPEWVCNRVLLLPLHALSTLWDFCATPNNNPRKYESVGTFFGIWGNMLKKSWIKSFFGIEAATLLPSPSGRRVGDEGSVLDESYRRTLSALKITKTLDKKSDLTPQERTKFNELKTKFDGDEPVTLQTFFSALQNKSDRAEKLCNKLSKINHPLTP